MNGSVPLRGLPIPERWRRLALPSLFFAAVIYYEELFLKLYCFYSLSPVGMLFTLLFTLPVALLLGLLCGGLPPRQGRVLLPLLTLLLSLWIGGPGHLLSPVQDLSDHLLSHQDGDGRRGLWRYGHHGGISQLVPCADDGHSGDSVLPLSPAASPRPSSSGPGPEETMGRSWPPLSSWPPCASCCCAAAAPCPCGISTPRPLSRLWKRNISA